MTEPMDIDLPLEEIIARNRAAQAAFTNSNSNNSNTPSKSDDERPSTYSRSRSKRSRPSQRSRRKSFYRKMSSSSRMDLDMSLDELIARRMSHGPHNKPQTQPRSYKPYYRPSDSFNSPFRNSRTGYRFPSRFITIGTFTADVTPSQIHDMLQNEVGPVQEVTVSLRGVAHVLFRRPQGWQAYDRFNGQWLDGRSRLSVRAFPLVPPHQPRNFGHGYAGQR